MPPVTASPHDAALGPALSPSVTGDDDDTALVDRVLAGERAAYAVLVRRHNQRLYRAARAVLRTDDEARDVVQHAWVAGFHRLTGWRREAPFAVWVTRIAVNEALSRRRHVATVGVPELLDDEDPSAVSPAPTPEDAVAQGELGRALERHIDALPEGYRLVFVLREVQGLDTAETAVTLGLTDETVRIRLFRARQLLRRSLSAALGAAALDAYHFAGERCDAILAAVSAALDLPV